MTKKQKYDNLYMSIADRVSQMSHAVRLKVGSILVKDGNIISFGWNGMPSGWDNNCEDSSLLMGDDGTESVILTTKQEVLHSEQNCLMKIARSTESSEGSHMYTTVAPCLNCAKLIFQAGVSNVYYRNSYRESSGVDFLTRSGVAVEHINDTNS